MPTSINDAEVRTVFEGSRAPETKRVMVGGNPVDVRTPFPSLEGWRDQWSYTLFTNKTANSGSGAGGIGPGPFVEGAAGNAEIHEVNGATTSDPARAFRVTLQKMEIQILRKKSGP